MIYGYRHFVVKIVLLRTSDNFYRNHTIVGDE